jgi:hypothetical protein
MAIDIDDPTTWDVDDKELLELAKAGAVPTAEAAAPVEAEKPAEPAVEAEPVLVPSIPEEAPIQAVDGKNTIPYSVLRDAREDARTAKTRLAQLEQELAALRTAPVVAPTPAATPEAPATLPPEVQQQIDKIKENWGEDIAAQAERTYWLEQHLNYQRHTIDQLSQKLQQQEQVTQQAQQRQQLTESEQIEDAIAANPKLDAWAKADDQGWFDRAVELHSVLLKTDRGYAAASWHDRMNALPSKVEALFGPSFQKIDVEGTKAKVQSIMDRPPTSLSEMGSGATPERTEIQKLEDLEGNQLTAHMNKLAQDPRKLDAYLRSLSG